jgi:rfaE bifunctional protein kinase chain/domain
MSAAITAPTTARLLELIDGMAGQSVVMLVDLVADRFITGSPKRISREAPVLILSYEQEIFTPGGGGNAVANIAGLEGKPLPLGIVGQDESGRRLLEALQSRGIDTSGIVERDGFRTPTKTRILSGARHSIKQQIVRYDIEDQLEPSASDLARFRTKLDEWAGQARVAVVSDYGYGAVQPELLPEIRKSLADGGRILGDSRHRLADLDGLDGASPNEEEAEALLGRPITDDNRELLTAGSEILGRLSADFLLITRGSYGMCLFDDGNVCRIPVHGTDQVADVTGAGDTVIGTFALALAAGASPLEASLLANYAGGIVVMKVGTATVSRAELEEAVSTDTRPLEELEWAKS